MYQYAPKCLAQTLLLYLPFPFLAFFSFTSLSYHAPKHFYASDSVAFPFPCPFPFSFPKCGSLRFPFLLVLLPDHSPVHFVRCSTFLSPGLCLSPTHFQLEDFPYPRPLRLLCLFTPGPASYLFHFHVYTRPHQSSLPYLRFSPFASRWVHGRKRGSTSMFMKSVLCQFHVC